ncbi:4-hydroxy-tetrahydrodipicolinate synthase [Companilactobacillus baiquanensis]|uniref:4-hydroxy-tetrahydrodipicolinate synthase n=1 Tax=Companilactobacillus baiquanensis TaxID=2486005 RepID=A0ABW1UTN5_9LACO|nr:4-hydroxy-tetrahydrodipicolinate synthase [Companilactobacillus baiquanensis]
MFDNVELMTAIITPFNDEATEINYDALEKLTNHLLEHGSQGFIIGGTTGETPTLTEDEKLALYKKFSEIIDGRVPIIAGVGSNNTQGTIDFVEKVGQIKGIDMALVVVPYYNKPNQRGMKAHFEAVAKASPIPVMIYNIPGRTGVLMDKDTVVELSKNENIQGIKQCNSLDDLEYIVEHTPDNFLVYSGEDGQALYARSIGANGVISVASHIYGDEISTMYKKLADGDVLGAGALQRELTPKMSALFMYPSPSPVKAVLNSQGFKVGGCRLPILSLNESEQKILFDKLGL